MTNEVRTALVVLATPASTQTDGGGYTAAGDQPVLPEGVESVRSWFSHMGFAVDPVVGISFSISGPGELFRSVFGSVGPGAVAELDQAALSDVLEPDLLATVAAVVIGPPPDFGPGNP